MWFGTLAVPASIRGLSLRGPGTAPPSATSAPGRNSIPGEHDIRANFSTNFNFYLGLDGNHGALVDLVTVVLHELGHGLNFQTFVDSTGANFGGFTDIYARHLVDASTGLHWNEMTNAERQASAIRFGQLVWDGANVSAGIPDVLGSAVRKWR